MQKQIRRRRFLWRSGRAHAAPAAPDREAPAVTIAGRILRAHNSEAVGDGMLRLMFDSLISTTSTYVGIVQTARSSGMETVSPALRADQLPQLAVRGGRHHQRGTTTCAAIPPR
jgi:hypothetical protein